MSRSRYNVVMSTDQGTFIVNKHDTGLTTHLTANGSFVPEEIAILRSLIGSVGRDDVVVLDIGANIGVFAVALADAVGPKGRIHAFEPQRIVYYMLAGNVALGSIENVHCHQLAVGAAPGRIPIPQFDYSRPMSFGSIEFGPVQGEEIGQQRRKDASRQEYVDMVSVDSLDYPVVHLMKIDVEGMELDVLIGAEKTIRRDMPIIFVEYFKGDRKAMARWLWAAGYRLFVQGLNWLCVPTASGIVVQGGYEITSEQQIG